MATQMGNQGYSHDATRVACEILWSGEIGEVKEVHAWTGRPSWPQEMDQDSAADARARDARLGSVARRCRGPAPFTAGDEEYDEFVADRNARVYTGRRSRRPGFGFYLPFNWRGFYDFGSSLIGDWGVHILGPANWGSAAQPRSIWSASSASRRTRFRRSRSPTSSPIRYDFAAASRNATGDRLLVSPRGRRRLHSRPA